VVKLAAFQPFTSAANALEQINAISEAQLTDDLKNFLTMNLPKVREGMGVHLHTLTAIGTDGPGDILHCQPCAFIYCFSSPNYLLPL
jgi:hypothetical protein